MATYTKIMNQSQVLSFYDEVSAARKLANQNDSDATVARSLLTWCCMLSGSKVAVLTAAALGTILTEYTSAIRDTARQASNKLGQYYDTLCINKDIDLVKFQVTTKSTTISGVEYIIPLSFRDIAYHSISKGWIELY